MSAVHSREFLELLVREASPVEFEGPLLEARAAGLDREALSELEQTKVLALRVRAILDRRQHREAALSALFDTASDLAGLRDLDAVLEAIVHRARSLLRTDITYMTLNDEERGDTHMRVTNGSTSAQFQALRLPLGAGLGGLVAQTAAPYATTSYLEDDRFHHTADIDQGVTEEGLVAILGVPMRLGNGVIGVLFAANRSARPFGQEEVALLCSLAAHAAVAIDTTRLLQETRAALDELSAANQVIREHSASVERAAEAHDRMTDLVLRGCGVQDVAASVTEVLGGSLLVLDADGRRLAAVGQVDDIDDDDLAAAVTASATTGRTVGRGPLRVASISAGTETLGALALRTDREVDDADQRILERAALATGLLLLFRRTTAEAEGRVRGELLDELLSSQGSDLQSLRERARRVGADLDTARLVVTARYEGGQRQRAAFWAQAYASERQGLASERGGEVVLLLPGDRPGDAARHVVRDLGAALSRPVTAGAAGLDSRAGGTATAHAEAQRCVEALVELDKVGEGASADELGFLGLLLGENRDVEGFVRSTLGPVLDYDARRGTALGDTLETYFSTGGSLAKTAAAMHVHVNTITQRLDRVGQLIGSDWQHPERSLETRIALRLHRLRRALGD